MNKILAVDIYFRTREYRRIRSENRGNNAVAVGKTIEVAQDEPKERKEKHMYTKSINSLLKSAKAPTYEKMEFEDMTDEQLKAKAEELLGSYKEQGYKALDKKYFEIEAELNKRLDSGKKEYEDLSNKLVNNYDEAKENVNVDTLKRGLARSSIATNRIDKVENSKLEDMSSLEKSYSDTKKEISDRLSGLSGEKNSEKSDVDSDYANKLIEKLVSLRKELDERKDEVTKYNNSIDEKIFSDKLREDTADRLEDESALDRAVRIQQMDEKYKNDYRYIASSKAYNGYYEKLKDMSKDDAKAYLKSLPNLSDQLHSFHYKMLISEFM